MSNGLYHNEDHKNYEEEDMHFSSKNDIFPIKSNQSRDNWFHFSFIRNIYISYS